MKINTIAPFEITERNEVTATGEPSYTSAVHKWNGTIESLNANPVNINMKAKIWSGLPSSNCGNSAKLIVPVAPYIMDIPNSKIPDENAEDIIIFIAASDEMRLSIS